MDEQLAIEKNEGTKGGFFFWFLIGGDFVGIGAWWYFETLAIPPVVTPTPENIPENLPPVPNLCMGAATATTTAYQRPSLEAATFGQLAPNDIVPIGGKTEDGWIGFDPMSAQAANVGPFRLRWLPSDAPIVLSPECDNVPVIPSLSGTACFIMVAQDVSVYESPNASSSIVASLGDEGYVEAVSIDATNEWVFVHSTQGTIPEGVEGYVSMETANFNGDCDLPETE